MNSRINYNVIMAYNSHDLYTGEIVNKKVETFPFQFK